MARNSNWKVPELASVGIDIGKDVFPIVGFDPNGKVVLRTNIFPRLRSRTLEHLPTIQVHSDGDIFRQCQEDGEERGGTTEVGCLRLRQF